MRALQQGGQQGLYPRQILGQQRLVEPFLFPACQKRLQRLHQIIGRQLFHIVAVQVQQFVEVIAGGRLANAAKVEPFDGLGIADNFVIAMPPTEAQQVVAHRHRQNSHSAIGIQPHRPMPFRQFLAVIAMNQGDMAKFGYRPAHRLIQLDLAKAVGQMVGAANHMGNVHVMIIHHHRQHIGGGTITTQQDHVVQLAILHLNPPLNQVVDHRAARLRRP